MATQIFRCLIFGIMVAVLIMVNPILSQSGLFPQKRRLGDLNHIPGFKFSDEEMKKLKLWENGIIPYFIDVFSYDKVYRDRIRDAFKDTNNYGGVHFMELNKPPTNENDRYVFILNRKGHSGCSDPPYFNLTTTGVQKVIFGYDCMSYGDLISAALSILGIPPENNSPIRDKYFTVYEDNIIDGKAHLFEKIPENEWLFYELPYDYESATHFNFHAYTKNGEATLMPVNVSFIPYGAKLGEPESFSYSDVKKMRFLYNYIHYKHSDIQSGECVQLFKPGKYDGNVNSKSSEEEMKPRFKPDQYTGGNSNEQNTENNSKENSDEKKTKDSSEKLIQKIKKKKSTKKSTTKSRENENYYKTTVEADIKTRTAKGHAQAKDQTKYTLNSAEEDPFTTSTLISPFKTSTLISTFKTNTLISPFKTSTLISPFKTSTLISAENSKKKPVERMMPLQYYRSKRH